LKLPKEAIIIEVSDENGGNIETVEDLIALQKEKNFLMKKLTSN